MPVPDSVDLDAIVRRALVQLERATRGWRKGRVLEEPALLNRLIENLSSEGQEDFGFKAPVQIIKELYVLHRAGPRQTDLHGADLAITIAFPPTGPTKTALFQLKATDDHRAQLERAQLEAARQFVPGWQNSFVLAVDRGRGNVRIAQMEPLLDTWDQGATRSVEVAAWDSGDCQLFCVNDLITGLALGLRTPS